MSFCSQHKTKCMCFISPVYNMDMFIIPLLPWLSAWKTTLTQIELSLCGLLPQWLHFHDSFGDIKSIISGICRCWVPIDPIRRHHEVVWGTKQFAINLHFNVLCCQECVRQFSHYLLVKKQANQKNCLLLSNANAPFSLEVNCLPRWPHTLIRLHFSHITRYNGWMTTSWERRNLLAKFSCFCYYATETCLLFFLFFLPYFVLV